MTRAPGLVLGIGLGGLAGWDVAFLVFGALLLLAWPGLVRRPRVA
ncbi:MAG TPA: hypothetical protein VFG79_24105 [Solirubrobacter sp.]|nr:hypothetical protein [Solirubrobacter sp.]